MKKAAVYTLGCKVNQVESEALVEQLQRRGYQLVKAGIPADLCIINTCSVTAASDRKSRNLIRRAARSNPGARVVVTGCLAELEPESIAAIEGVDLAAGNSLKDSLIDLIECQSDQIARHLVALPPENTCPTLPRIYYERPHQRSRAFIKIADGCQNFCSYCIIPYARGPVKSKKAEDVIAEINQLQSIGYREIVLTGINIGFYGHDLPGTMGLTELLARILRETGDGYRLRLGSLNPLEIKPELLEMVNQETRLCRHLHIPLQSGSDSVLQRMGRAYNGVFFAGLLEQAARLIEGIGLTTDVITGFPGESEGDFSETRDLLASLPLLNMHVFRYSPRPGTPAATMSEQVPEASKEVRSRELLTLAREKRASFLSGMIGRECSVLVEQPCGTGIYRAIGDNYVEIFLESECDLTGRLLPVIVDRIDENGSLWGSLPFSPPGLAE